MKPIHILLDDIAEHLFISRSRKNTRIGDGRIIYLSAFISSPNVLHYDFHIMKAMDHVSTMLRVAKNCDMVVDMWGIQRPYPVVKVINYWNGDVGRFLHLANFAKSWMIQESIVSKEFICTCMRYE
tara:strand:+ start:294 stop:671 length:378 start_codon:yes stop_codon:yes gene_type:complete